MDMINHDRWQLVERIFNSICELPVNKQTSVLTNLCEGDTELYDEVEGLLIQNHEAKSFLEIPVFEKGLFLLFG